MIDVKEIHDIPHIEKHLEKEFILELYEKGENLQIYHHKLNSGFFLSVEIESGEKLIEGKEKLINLILQDDINFFRFSLVEKATDIIVEDSSWIYINKDKKASNLN